MTRRLPTTSPAVVMMSTADKVGATQGGWAVPEGRALPSPGQPGRRASSPASQQLEKEPFSSIVDRLAPRASHRATRCHPLEGARCRSGTGSYCHPQVGPDP